MFQTLTVWQPGGSQVANGPTDWTGPDCRFHRSRLSRHLLLPFLLGRGHRSRRFRYFLLLNLGRGRRSPRSRRYRT